MRSLPQILTLMLLLGTLACWTQPAEAGRLANLSGEADANEKRVDAPFKLSDQSQIQIQYNITKLGDSCNVTIRIHRKQENGRWLVVNTPVRTTQSTKGAKPLTLPAGEYKIEVIAKQARYDVSVDL